MDLSFFVFVLQYFVKYEMVYHFLKSFLIGLGFYIVVNTMNIWMDIYIMVPHFTQKLRKNLRHMIQN